jgi:hypothetical protein
MVLVISFHAHAVPNDTVHVPAIGRRPAEASPAVASPLLVPAFPTLSDRPGLAVVALGTAAALVSSYVVARFAHGWLTGGARRRGVA